MLPTHDYSSKVLSTLIFTFASCLLEIVVRWKGSNDVFKFISLRSDASFTLKTMKPISFSVGSKNTKVLTIQSL